MTDNKIRILHAKWHRYPIANNLGEASTFQFFQNATNDIKAERVKPVVSMHECQRRFCKPQ